ncbi:unnamed protein product [Adineta steineri]|uniref:C2 domain-containing protein n=2 Tax=Adineta steineri TaxID=433720 RepID=A0A818TWU5_9BILA|nr:unnamed protein product [Adineta steineri]CAF3690665.1 unnamed protein product [Adineta steineri]
MAGQITTAAAAPSGTTDQKDYNLQNVAIPVEPVAVPSRSNYDLPPVMAMAKYSGLFPHVAPRSKDLLHILVHGAANLPFIDGRQPRCYVTAQSRSTMATQDIGETINATNVIEGISPHWNEMIYADILEDTNHSEEVIILIIDEPRQRTIAEHRFPWRWLEPFYQYHVNLQHTLTQTSQTTSLFLSVMRKQSSLSKEDIRYFGLEVLLNRFEAPLIKTEVLYAVARIVPDYETYKHDNLRNQDNPQLGIDFRKITMPSAQDFNIATYSYGGFPQVSLASKESKVPTWMHNYLFSHEHEKDNMFSNSAALVIEFYGFRPINNNPNWFIKGLLGWVTVRLDTRTYDALTAPNSADGMRTDGMLVESDGQLVAESSKYLTSEVLLRLIAERHPGKNLVGFAASNLPILPSYFVEGVRHGAGAAPPVYLQVTTDQPVLPPMMPQQQPQPVMQTGSPIIPGSFIAPQFYGGGSQYGILPSIQLIDKGDGVRFHVPRINQYDMTDLPTEYRTMLPVNFPPRSDDDIDGWFDYFQREVANYQSAIRRVIVDVTQLRQQLGIITAANQDLKMRIDNFDKKKKVLYEIFEGDKLDKEKIRDIFNRLSARISAQQLELKENYGKISTYEKEIARKGELRDQYDALVRTMQAREIELRLMRERLGKADGLEETVRHQEIVIEKLESMINNYMRDKRSRGMFTDVDQTFLSQHASLTTDFDRRQTNRQETRIIERPIIVERPVVVERTVVETRPAVENRTVIEHNSHTGHTHTLHDHHHHHDHDHRCSVHKGLPRKTTATKKTVTIVDDEDAKRQAELARQRDEATRQRDEAARQREALLKQREDLVRQNLTYQQELANLKARFQENAAGWGREKAELISRINDIDQP